MHIEFCDIIIFQGTESKRDKSLDVHAYRDLNDAGIPPGPDEPDKQKVVISPGFCHKTMELLTNQRDEKLRYQNKAKDENFFPNSRRSGRFSCHCSPVRLF